MAQLKRKEELMKDIKKTKENFCAQTEKIQSNQGISGLQEFLPSLLDRLVLERTRIIEIRDRQLRILEHHITVLTQCNAEGIIRDAEVALNEVRYDT